MRDFPNVTEVNKSSPKNADDPIVNTESGITILLIFTPINALEPISVTEEPMITVVREKEYLNAEPPILVTEFGITTDVRLEL
jgi:hypothetical protein